MKKQKLFIGLSLCLTALLASCSYGGTSILSHADFTSFYNEAQFSNEKTHKFVVGDDITITDGSIDEFDNVITREYVLSSSSIARWQEANSFGSTLSFASSVLKTDSNGTQVKIDESSASLGHSSAKKVDADNENIVTNTSTFTYQYDVNSVSGSVARNNPHEITSETDTYSVATVSNDGGTTTSETITTWTSSITVSNYNDDVNIITLEKSTISEETTTSFTYSETVDSNNDKTTSLTYSKNEVNMTIVEQLDSNGSVTSGVRTIDTVTSTTAQADSSSSGSKITKQDIANYSGGSYVPDAGASTTSTDSTYRYEVTSAYLTSLERDALLATWQGLDELDNFLNALSSFYNDLFINFESYLAGDVKDEEIIRAGLTYQYRSRLSSDETAHTIKVVQYTFICNKADVTASTMTEVSLLSVSTIDQSIVTLGKTILIY